MIRSDYLTAAVLLDGDASDDFADVIHNPNDDRIQDVLRTGFTRAIFNAAGALKLSVDPVDTFPLLKIAFEQMANPVDWEVLEKGEADLAMSLLLIEIELLDSAALCGEVALPLFESVLNSSNDALHFAVFNGMKSSEDSTFFDLASAYVSGLKQRSEYDREIFSVADDAMCACLPF